MNVQKSENRSNKLLRPDPGSFLLFDAASTRKLIAKCVVFLSDSAESSSTLAESILSSSPGPSQLSSEPSSTNGVSSNQLPGPSGLHQSSLEEALAQGLLEAKSPWIEAGDELEEGTYLYLDVTRHNFWLNVMETLSRQTDEEWQSRLKVTFLGESAADTGGPSREFISLLYTNAAISGLLEGQIPHMTFSHNQTALNKGHYRYFGALIAISLLNGLSGPNYFQKPLLIKS